MRVEVLNSELVKTQCNKCARRMSGMTGQTVKEKEVPRGHPGRRAYLIAYLNELAGEMSIEQLEAVVIMIEALKENSPAGQQ